MRLYKRTGEEEEAKATESHLGREKRSTPAIRAVPNTSSQGKAQTLLHGASCLPSPQSSIGRVSFL